MTWRPISHTDYPWADSPSTSSPLDTANLNSMEDGIVGWAESNMELLGIAATATQTSAYTANAGDFVPVDTSTAAVTVTLPAAVADQARVGVKQVNGPNGVTINASGGAAFDRVGGSTSISLAGTQSAMMQYSAALNVWHVMSRDTSVVVDTTASDFQMDGTASAGSTGKIADAGHVHPTDTSRAVQLSVKSVKTATFGPTAGSFVPYDISGGSISDVLPNAPADGSIVAVKVTKVSGQNRLTISTQGSDTIDDGVSTSRQLWRKGQASRFQYSAGPKVWYEVDADRGIGLDYALFTANGSWAVPPGITEVRIRAVGGGGGGGGGDGGNTDQAGSGGGGAGFLVDEVVPLNGSDTSLTISIGAGGSGGSGGTTSSGSAGNGSNGSNGGSSTVVGATSGTVYVSTSGGLGGVVGQDGGAGGVGAGGAFASVGGGGAGGGAGSAGYPAYPALNIVGGAGGGGGGASLGGGGGSAQGSSLPLATQSGGGLHTQATNVGGGGQNAGMAGCGGGGGGGGSPGSGGGVGGKGGNGASGQVEVWW